MAQFAIALSAGGATAVADGIVKITLEADRCDYMFERNVETDPSIVEHYDDDDDDDDGAAPSRREMVLRIPRENVLYIERRA